MKILILADAYFEDTVYQINNFVKYYLKDGHDVVVICSTIDNVFDYYNNIYSKKSVEQIKILKNLKIIRKKYRINIFFKIRKFGNIFKLLIDEKPDLVFVQDIHFNLHEVCYYKKKVNNDCRIIMNFHSDYSNSANNHLSYYILHRLIRKYYIKSNLKYIDKIYPIIEKSKEFLIEMYSLPDNKLEILPIGIDTDLFLTFKNSNNQENLKSQLGIPPDSVIIFTGGKIEEFKKSEIVLQAINSLSNHKVYLIVVGKLVDQNPAYVDRYNKLLSQNDNIKYLGWKNQHELYSYMSICDIAIFPSSQTVLWQYSIGMGMVLIAGKYLEYKNGKSFEQDLEYLNLNDNIVMLDKNIPYEKQIILILADLINNPGKLELMKKGALKTANDFLDFNKLIKKTYN